MLQGCYGGFGIGLYAVADYYVAGVFSVDGYVHKRPFVMAGAPGGTFGFHEEAVSDSDFASVHDGADALASRFDYPFHRAVVVLVGVGFQKGHCDGMRRVALDMGGQVQKLLLVNYFGVNCCYLEYTFCEGAGLVEDQRFDIGQLIHEVGTFDKNALS